MSLQDFLILYASVLASMIACRCIPLFVLKGRELSPRLSQALGLIPAASFAALVANDLINPSAFVANPLQATVPFVAAAGRGRRGPQDWAPSSGAPSWVWLPMRLLMMFSRQTARWLSESRIRGCHPRENLGVCPMSFL